MQNNPPDFSARAGKWMIVAAWLAALGLLTLLFSNVLERKYNPNQKLQTNYQGETREVVLQSSRHGHYIATGQINNKSVVFLVDTGASFVSVPENLANKLDLKKGVVSQSTTANGVINTFATTLDEISLGDITLYDVRASINPYMQGDEVLLGMSFLRQLEVIHKDGELKIRQ